MTTYLFRSETKQFTMNYGNELGTYTVVLFENKYFYCTYSIKTKILSMLGTGYFLKLIAKVIPSKKKQSVPMAKIGSYKTQKIRNPQK